MKKLLAIILVLSMAVALCACGAKTEAPAEKPADAPAAEANDPVTLIIAHASGTTHPYSIGIETAISKLAEISDGSITIDHQGAGVLGGEVACIEAAILGDIEMSCGADMSYASFTPALYALNFPGVFADYDAVNANYFAGWGRQHVEEQLAEKGLKLVALFDNCFRWWSNNDHPVNTIDGLDGMKIRVPESEYMVSFYEAIGCQCATIALGELAVALQQGVADAQELSPTSAYPRGYYTYQKYWTESNCGYSGAIVAINEEIWNSMSAQQQAWLTEAFAAAEVEERAYAAEYMQDCIDKMVADGCEFLRGDFEGKAELTEAMIEIGKGIAVAAPYDQYFTAEVVANMYP